MTQNNLARKIYSDDFTSCLLEEAYNQINNSKITEALDNFYAGLRHLKLNCSVGEWKYIVGNYLMDHPIKEFIYQDPITERAYNKPRGYAGDAYLLDMIYGHPSVNFDGVNELGNEIREYTFNTTACDSVRLRRQYIARVIDSVARATDKTKVLSIGCGHLREIELSESFRNDEIEEYTAIDQDIESVNYVNRNYSGSSVQASAVSVVDILRNNFKHSGYDLIYASGLYDYLKQRTAQKLTHKLFQKLSPQGVLLITNVLPEMREIGYMESFMDWELIGRDQFELLDCTSDIPKYDIDNIIMSFDKHQNIGFLQVNKK